MIDQASLYAEFDGAYSNEEDFIKTIFTLPEVEKSKAQGDEATSWIPYIQNHHLDQAISTVRGFLIDEKKWCKCSVSASNVCLTSNVDLPTARNVADYL